MTFVLQLKLLIWKNFILRKRQKGRLVVEIIWPLFLFAILVLVRLRNLKKYHHECYFEEKAMPSAGFATFAQSFLCTFNNTCLKSHWTEPNKLQTYNQSLFNRILFDVEDALKENFNSKQKVDALTRVIHDLRTVRNLQKKILTQNIEAPLEGFNVVKAASFFKDPGKITEDLYEFLQRKNVSINQKTVESLSEANVIGDKMTISNLLRLATTPRRTVCEEGLVTDLVQVSNREDLDDLLDRVCNLTSSDWRELGTLIYTNIDREQVAKEANNLIYANVDDRISFEDWAKLFDVGQEIRTDLGESRAIVNVIKDILSLTDEWNEIQEDIEPPSALNNSSLTPPRAITMLVTLSRLICGKNRSFSEFSSGGRVTRFDQLRDQLQDKEGEEFVYVNDNTTTEECNDFMKSMESSRQVRFLWNQLKPFIRGKILYTPDTNATRRIIKVANETFRPIEIIQGLAQNWSTAWGPQMRIFAMDNDNQDFFKDILTSEEEGNLLDIILSIGNNSTATQQAVNVTSIRQRAKTFFEGNYSENINSTLNQIEEMVKNISIYMECFDQDKFKPVETEEELVTLGLELIESNQFWGGLVFSDFSRDQVDDSLPKHVRYKIRLDANKVDSTKKIEDRLSRPGPRRRPGIDLKYLYYGFAYLQDMVEHAIIREQTGRETLPGITLQQMPYPCYIEDRFIITIARTFPLFMTLAWVYSASMIIKSVVHEKEKRLKETMRVMGLTNGVHWISWFIDSFSVMFISTILLTIILVQGNILEKSDPSLVFCFMLLYCTSTIMLSFFLSTLFSRANVAAAAGGIIFFCLYLPYSFMVVWESFLHPSAKFASCFISNIAFGFGCSYFSHYEESGVGAQWDNVWISPLVGDHFSMASCMGMLLLDSIIYGILMWYIEAVFPGEYGVPKPFYFFLTKSYWCGSKNTSHSDQLLQMEGGELQKDVEREPTHLPLGVSIKRLYKVYKSGKVAVEDLNLNFYEGQITSFLGHNGAGKTTTISILTGLFPPSAGTAKINGLDIQKDMDTIRKSLGTCPQHNVLFDQLSVFEHLWFYSRLKGQDVDQILEQCEVMLQDLGIPNKKHELSKNLSGGMQRKLSIACAFVGGSRVIVLDEPTAGVDPYSRRAIWDLLVKYKPGRTIILTTHFMDEADLLGDRIAIINRGKLVCCGSSLFLKSLYGVGYYLTLVKNTETADNVDGYDNVMRVKSAGSISAMVEGASNLPSPGDLEDEGISDISTSETIINPSKNNQRFPVYPLTKFIQKYVPNASLVEQIGSEIVFILPPTDGDARNRFETLFDELDKNLKKLNILSYGISDTTLEEIFLKVASNEQDGEIIRQKYFEDGAYPSKVRSGSIRKSFDLASKLERKKDDLSNTSGFQKVNVRVEDNQKTYTDVPEDEIDKQVLTSQRNPNNPMKKSAGKALTAKHIIALEIKRFHHSKRNKKGLVCEIVLPALFVCLGMIFTVILPPLTEEPELDINPWIYPGKGGENAIFFSNDNPGARWPDLYTDQLFSKDGFGTRCLKNKVNMKFEKEIKLENCLKNNISSHKPEASYSTLSQDDEKNPECSCSIGTQVCPAGAAGPQPPVYKTPTMDLLLDLTSRNVSQWLIKTRHNYFKKRYGGFEFGVRNPLAGANYSQAQDIFTRLTKATNQGEERLHWLATNVAFDTLEAQVLTSSSLDNVRVWFNNKGWASSVAYMNTANNIILRASLKQKELAEKGVDLDDDFWDDDSFMMEEEPEIDLSEYGISVVNHPMNYTKGQLDKEVIRQIGVSLLHAICIIFAMSFVPASFVVFHIEERVSNVKHLHFVSGVRFTTYWSAAFLWDLLMYTISAFLCLIIFLIFDTQAYVSADNVTALVFLLLLYGWSSVPLMYPASFAFSIPSSAFVTLSCSNLFIGIITTVTTFVLENFDDEELKYIGSILKKVFLVFPQYCLGRGLMDMATEHNLNEVVSKFGLISVRNRFDFDFLGKYFLCMLIQGFIFFTVTLTLQSKFWVWRKNNSKIDFTKLESTENEDIDVANERNRVINSDVGLDPLQVKNLFKRYGKNGMPAVNHLTFGVHKGECFGLLGVNGAGKTSTFKMMTGDTTVTAGEAFINGFSILDSMREVQQSLGYCPQFDALDPLLTGREHLRLYARLRGLDEDSVKSVADWGLTKLGLVAYSDTPAGQYSGGNKRKLSTAIALIGNPSLVFLDEPTSGMDPGARRFLWNCILEMVRGGQSVVLTSHSMEECEALCSRIGIMVNGQFKCLGSIQHLKNRFGSGYTLTIRCKEGSKDEICERIETLFPLAELKEGHHSQVQYQLPIEGTQLAVIFKHMDQLRVEGRFEDYSITQTTLDEVFVRFASEQTDLLKDEGVNVRGSTRQIARRVFESLSLTTRASPSRNTETAL